ncbi:hypothetical protein AB1N83_006985 [Pleurotus pulmonarius]
MATGTFPAGDLLRDNSVQVDPSTQRTPESTPTH